MTGVKEKRLSWDEYFLGLADAASKRATCKAEEVVES
jgi:deoxycytidylate deaminase